MLSRLSAKIPCISTPKFPEVFSRDFLQYLSLYGVAKTCRVLELQGPFAKEPYNERELLQQRPVNL